MAENGEIKPVRCAIYTRKSTTENMQSDFTSLDAQRESAESYIKSQQHQGWVLLKETYNDGGFTGANTDRPAFQKLLQDIRDKKVDCVVVYKVDRLSRSLSDFVRVLQFFEEQQVTFVSITQHFNTNTSMGRLTLNILLSFAQFEREMISERTKDKMGAARKKGKWVGGLPGLGYTVDKPTKKLIINPEEAALIRRIFQLYLEGNSLRKIAQILNAEGFRTKKYPGRKRNQGGVLFRITNIQLMLKNPTYMGKIQYEGKLYQGLHSPIVTEEVFKKVQDMLKANFRERGVSKNRKFPGLLTGLFRCACCKTSLGHTYARGRNKNFNYRYYVCLYSIQHDWKGCPTKSIIASVIESKCLDFVIQLTKDKRLTAEDWPTLPLEKQSAILKELVKGIEYDGHKGKLWIELNGALKKHEFDLPLAELKKRLPDTTGISFANEPLIRKQLLLAHQIQGMLADGRAKDLHQIAGWLNLHKSRLDQVISLLFLGPQIQEAIIQEEAGRLTAVSERAIRAISEELDWQKQLTVWHSLLNPAPSAV
jgi:DNA invertase Pin-like site-specific DNA recombinase